MPKLERPNIQIGTKLWHRRHSPGPYTVTGETSRSWLVRHPDQPTWQESTKIPKARLPEDWTLSEQTWIDWKFAQNHANEISYAVQGIRDGALLRKIAGLIGYKEDDAQPGARPTRGRWQQGD